MDTFTKKKRSQIMACVKSDGNKSTELALLKIFKKKSIKGWRRNYNLIGKPDFVFPSLRIAVFVDGCFWHGCKKHARMPSSNKEYWLNKINRNIARDKLVRRKLKEKNWKVIRIWEHELMDSRLTKKLSKLKEKLK